MAETPPLPRRVAGRNVPSFCGTAQAQESTGVLPTWGRTGDLRQRWSPAEMNTSSIVPFGRSDTWLSKKSRRRSDYRAKMRRTTRSPIVHRSKQIGHRALTCQEIVAWMGESLISEGTNATPIATVSLNPSPLKTRTFHKFHVEFPTLTLDIDSGSALDAETFLSIGGFNEKFVS